jgi:deazaflavin-dependent oxidoreductase (nitroreductase family)
MTAAERTHNPFLNSAAGGRALSALQLPFFALRPPPAYGVLTTTGRKTGKARRRCVRAVRSGNKAYVVAIKGGRTGWLRNIRANPNVRLRIRGGTFAGLARDPSGAAEREEAIEAYCETVGWFERLEYTMWRRGRPTPPRIRGLHRRWFDDGVPLVIELSQ